MTVKTESKAVTDAVLTSEILRSLAYRDRAVSVCPSQIARSVADDRVWRPLMPRIRGVLVQLVREQRVIVTRGTRVLSVEEIEGGPIRIRRGPQFDCH
jgi:Protein of unknown function (DUF3253)